MVGLRGQTAPMASAASHREQSPESDDRIRSEEFHTPMSMEGNQYREIRTTQPVPTKSEYDDPMSDVDPESERPVSAGTAHGDHLGSENAEDVLAELAVNADNRPGRIASTNEPSGQLLVRPTSSDMPNLDTSFSFARASRHQIDFTGTWKGPAINMPSSAAQKDVPVKTDTDYKDDNAQDAMLQDGQGLQEPSESVDATNAHGDKTIENKQTETQAESPLKEPKRKKKKKRRYATALTEPIDDNGLNTPARTTDEVNSPIQTEHALGAGSLEASAPVEAMHDAPFEQRQHTPTYTMIDNEHQEQPSSPHSQLQADLQDAVRPASPLNSALPSHSPADQQVEEKQRDHVMVARELETFSQPQQHGLDHREQTHRALNRVSDQPVSATVSKRKSRASWRATAPTPSDSEATSEASPTIHDWMQIIQYKIREEEEKASAKFATERESLQVELQQTFDAKTVLQGDLDNVLQQKDSLNETVDKQKAKIATLESNIKRFKTFVDGLGNDVDALKKEANATRRKSEQLVQEKDDRKAERDALYRQLSDCAERSTDLKDRALRACQETQSQLQTAVQRSEYMDQQLNEKVGLLAEERDRRAQLERQLASVASSDDKVLQMLKANNDVIVGKLNDVHTALQQDQSEKETLSWVEKTFAEVQALSSGTAGTMKDVSSVKELVEKLSQSLTNHLNDSTASGSGGQADTTGFQEYMNDALTKLQEELGQRETLVHQVAENRQTIQSLDEKLKACNIRITDGQSKLSDAKKNESRLSEQNVTLEAKIAGLQDKSLPVRNASAQLKEAKAELDAKAKDLDTAKADLVTKTEELRSLTMTKTDLQKEVQTLNDRLQDIQNTVVDTAPNQEELERRVEAAKEQTRKELVEDFEKFETQLRTNANNDLKKITSERNRLERQVKPMQEELATCKTQIQQLQKGKPAGAASRSPELDRAKKLAESQKNEIEKLQSSIKDLQTAAKDAGAMQEKYSTLSAHFTAEKSKLKEVVEEKSVLLKQVKDLRHASEEAQLAGEQVKSEFEKLRTEKESAVNALEQELKEAKKAAERSAAGLDHFKESCDKAIDDEKAKGDRQVKALQERLSEAQTELQIAKVAQEKFRAEIEQTWQQEQKEFEEQSAAIRTQIVEAEARRDEALATNESLRQEHQTALDEQRKTLTEQLDRFQQRAETADEKLKAQQRPWSKETNVLSRLHVPSLKDGITPTASLRSKEPPRPRKKADRNNNAIVEVDPIPAPEELRGDSRKTDLVGAKEHAKGPVVEETQLVPNSLAGSSTDVPRLARQPNSFAASSDNDDILTIRDLHSRHLPETVEETQFDERLPSFAAFNSSFASVRDPMSKPDSSMPSAHPARASESSGRTAQHQSQAIGVQHIPDDFVIYEDSQGPSGSQGLQGVEERRQLQNSLDLDQAEKNKYTFQKSLPHPNSASKIVYPDGRQSDSLRRHRSNTHDSTASRDKGFKTPHVSREGKDEPMRGVNPANPRSSSPDFVHASKAVGRKRSATYHTPGGSAGKRGPYRTNSGPTADSRLASRNPPVGTKRKSEGHIVEGYEHERKKRLNGGSGAAESTGRSLRSQTQASINDLPQFPAMHAGPRGSQQGVGLLGSQSRMRTLAGGSSRATRGVKMSKNDGFNARFSQELDGR